MMWEQPKTDWKSGDFFNVSDYNRIKGNLDELRNVAMTMWSSFDDHGYKEMGADKTYQDISFFADEINAFEYNLEIINQNILTQDYGKSQMFFDNGPFIGSAELNRIESAILSMYEILKRQEAGLRKLSFRLGNMKGVAV